MNTVVRHNILLTSRTAVRQKRDSSMRNCILFHSSKSSRNIIGETQLDVILIL